MRRAGKEEQVQGIKHRSRCWLGAFLLILSVDVSAQLHISRSYMWGHPASEVFQQPVGTCVYSYPDSMPFSVHRPVVVDNSIPDGTILMSWDYADLNTSIMLNCTGNGTESSFLNILNVESSITIVSADIALAGLGFGLSGSGSGILNTSVGGVGIRFYVRSDSPNLGSDGNSSAYIRMSGFGSSGTEYAASGVEYPLIGPTTGMAALVLRMMDSRTEGGHTFWYMPSRSVSLSLRAELIKTGYVTSYGPLSVSHLFNSWVNPAPTGIGTNPDTNFLSGNGVTLVRPTCKLSSQRPTDYTVNMGIWDADTITREGAPAFGADVPVPVELECNGMAENVRMRFEDAGESPLPVGNLSLYDAAGGNKIDGLEIELRYNGNHIDINGSAVDIGSYGSGATSVAGDKIFAASSASFMPITFQARYIQRATIARAGVNYTGPVSGTVNLFMVYD